jgi:hypothetical protein
VIAALFVANGGAYFGMPNVDPWDAARDARTYAGPWPVVAHPPCARWCRLAGLVESRWGHRRGDDDGCFESALASVRKWGGVLEHPAWSDAWAHFGLPEPEPRGGWRRNIWDDDGYACHVEQGRYGHPAKKATWLYAHGVQDLPVMRWGATPHQLTRAWVSWCGNNTRGAVRTRLTKRAALSTPAEFRDQLVSIAESATAACEVAHG